MSETGSMSPEQALRSANATAEMWRKYGGERDKIIAQLEREREEDRAAIRALKEDHDLSGWTLGKNNPCVCEVCTEHAAAIARAQGAK